jgi:hypothetical protein
MQRHIDSEPWEPMSLGESIKFYAAMCGAPAVIWVIALVAIFY